jgi:hypothetical protein
VVLQRCVLLNFTHLKSRQQRPEAKMAEAKPVKVEQEQKNEELGVPALDVENDRDTFLPRPSDSPHDPLNWSMFLKVM